MSPKEFRESPELVAEMRKIFELLPMQMWLESMDEDNPAKRAAPVGIQSHDAFIMLGEQTGWMNYRDRFRLGGVPLEIPKESGTARDQTYGELPPEPEE